jgi:caffeoyl-CoA O-methyltransferase
MRGLGLIASFLAMIAAPSVGSAQSATSSAELDARVEAFLKSRRGSWRDLNVPEVDGRTLYDLILKNQFKHAVEIGTSTGHSTIWIAWALSKTGGRLITIEIDPERHRAALGNLQAAGLAEFVDARLADAHELVPRLTGPIDFVFSDADKEWYKNYFVALWPKMAANGCFTAHNVTMGQRSIRDFLDHIQKLPDGRTTIDKKSRAGVSITCKMS